MSGAITGTLEADAEEARTRWQKLGERDRVEYFQFLETLAEKNGVDVGAVIADADAPSVEAIRGILTRLSSG